MIEFAQGYFNLEHPVAKMTVHAGRLTLRGWLVGKPTEILTDLRGRCAGRLWAAVYGFIRAGRARHRVASHFDSAHVLPRQPDLAHQTIAIQTTDR